MEWKDCLIPQPTVALDAGEADFPEFIFRCCCQGKSCSSVDLHRSFGHDWVTGRRVYGYKRGSNDEWYFGPTSSLPLLAERLNNADLWPVDEDLRDRYYAEQEAAGAYGPFAL